MALLLVSGHAYRATHINHHRVFPGPDDPEGDAARLSIARALLAGPMHVPRIWLWAFRRRPGERTWLVAEALVPVVALVIGVEVTAVLLYVLVALVAGWL